MAADIFNSTQRYRIRTQSSDYLLTVVRDVGKRKATLEGYSERLKEELYAEDVAPEVEGASLFATPAAQWIGKTLKVGHIVTSDVRSIAAADGEWGEAGTRVTRISSLRSAPLNELQPSLERGAARDVTGVRRGFQERSFMAEAPVQVVPNPGLVIAAEEGTFRDIKHELEWQLHVTDGVSFNDARSLPASFGSGWRLPTATELRTLMRRMWGPQAPWVWTRSVHAADLGLAVAYWPANQEERAWLRTNTFAVRCVRPLSAS